MPHLIQCIDCGTLTQPARQGRCPDCQTDRTATTRNGSTAAWRKVRRLILDRDNHTCVECSRYANEVDHLIPKSMGGTDDPSNLRALCRRCNNGKGGKYPDVRRH